MPVLTQVYRALCAHMAPMGLPLYLRECVPADAEFPYITARIAVPLAPHAAGSVTLTFWSLDGQPHSRRVFQADELLKLLPARGFHLDTAACTLTLRQEGGALCIREGAALGVRTVWKLRCFPTAKEVCHADGL